MKVGLRNSILLQGAAEIEDDRFFIRKKKGVLYLKNEEKTIFTDEKNTLKRENTPYDDVGRTLLVDCPRTIIPLINEIFGEKYTGDETIEFLQESNYVNLTESEMIRGYRDAYFKITGEESKRYHIELQCTEDHTMVLRMFEYDIGAALKECEMIENKLILTIARSAVIYLRHNKNTPDTLKVVIRTPGGEISYKLPVIKIKIYSLEEIFEKKLLFLLPFYIFGYESQLKKINRDQEKLEKLKEEYRKIKEYLDNLQEKGELTEREKSVIVSMIKKVVRNLAAKYDNVKKGVGNIMGGRVLVHEAYMLTEKGRAMERKNTEIERRRAEAAEQRAEKERKRAEKAEQELLRMKELLQGEKIKTSLTSF